MPEKPVVYHVYPTGFPGEPEHLVDAGDEPCWCHPLRGAERQLDGKLGYVVIHNRPN